jgi:hypothetical protein
MAKVVEISCGNSVRRTVERNWCKQGAVVIEFPRLLNLQSDSQGHVGPEGHLTPDLGRHGQSDVSRRVLHQRLVIQAPLSCWGTVAEEYLPY